MFTGRFSLALVVTSFLASSASASFVEVTTVSLSDVQVVTCSLNGVIESVYAGAFQSTLFSTGGSAVTGPLTTYCVDLADELQATQNVNIAAITTLAGGNGAYVGSLYANFAAGATTAVEKAGLQLAIWKTEYDGANATSNTGHFVVSAASCDVTNAAIYYYTHNTLTTSNVSYIQVVPGGAGQSLIGPSLSSLDISPNAVPEPASVAMLTIGLLGGLGVSVHRARRSIAR